MPPIASPVHRSASRTRPPSGEAHGVETAGAWTVAATPSHRSVAHPISPHQRQRIAMRRKRRTSRLLVAALAGSVGLAVAVLPLVGLAPQAVAAGPDLALGKTLTASSYTQTYTPG